MAIKDIKELMPDVDTKTLSSEEDYTKYRTEVIKLIEEKLELSLDKVKEQLSAYAALNAQKLSKKLSYIAPYNDYKLMIEEKEDMAKFISTECVKNDTWRLACFHPAADYDELIKFQFDSLAVDDGKSLTGFAFLNYAGAIKHVFVSVIS